MPTGLSAGWVAGLFSPSSLTATYITYVDSASADHPKSE
jgi:hypothetical protein